MVDIHFKATANSKGMTRNDIINICLFTSVGKEHTKTQRKKGLEH